MDHRKLVLVQVFGSRTLPRACSKSAGIDAMIQAETAGGMDPAIAWGDIGFRVLVREDDAA